MTDENHEEDGLRPIGIWAKALLMGAAMAAITAAIVLP